MPRIQLNTNGVTPLADTAGGQAGTVLGSERLKLQTIGSTQEAVLVANTTIGGAFAALASVSLAAGTWLVQAQAVHSYSDAGATEFRVRNTTDSTTLAYVNDTEAASGIRSSPVALAGRVVVLAGTKTFALEAKTAHSLADTATGNANGPACFISALRLA